MITITIKEIATKRGITTAYQLQKEAQLPPSMAARLWKGEMEMIGISTLDKLCNKLKCKPNDILRFVPDNEEK